MKLNYRSFAYFASVLTGFASLCAQVAWQKYLTILVGSETLSISLVIAVFLLGLAAGYYVFGRLTEKSWTRWSLLKFYSYTELAAAFYMIVFSIYFGFLKDLSFSAPPHLAADALISFLALFFPTFLMGASLPALTAALPDHSEEINSVHIQVYGWNTLGAFIGVLAAGFLLIPLYGLELTLLLAGGLNLAAALIFMANPLKGYVHKEKQAPAPLPSRIPNRFYAAAAFAAGAIVVSFEVLFIRLLHVSIGAGVYNFPIILSLFVGGLAAGSLSIKPGKISAGFFIRQLLITGAILTALFIAAPYWSIWISHGRVSLLSIPSNYIVFKVFIYLFLALFIFPAVFFMGRLLPLAYALLKKNRQNYGGLCGSIYFFNTLGTVFGALAIGYLAFYIFELDDLFKINIGLLAALSLTASLYEKARPAALASLLLALCAIALPAWNRTGHQKGYFRIETPKPFHFQKVFYLPKNHKGEVFFYKDGPNISGSLISFPDKHITPEAKALFPQAGKSPSVSFMVNAKSIGNTLGDFSTMFLLSSLGYLYSPDRPEGLSSAVIGLGTGISAGLLARLKEIREVSVLEIAPEVIEMVKKAPGFSFDLLSSPKAQIIPQDAFKYFTKTKKKFDLIVSEPSNPWVVGVENVFSKEFYEIAAKTLTENGILVQWVQTYSIDKETLSIIFHTLSKVFPYAKLYKVGVGDIALIAGSKPLRKKQISKRFFEPELYPYHKALGLRSPEDLDLLQFFSESLFAKIAKLSVYGAHSLTNPKLAYRADKTFFLQRPVNPINFAHNAFFDSAKEADKKIKSFKKYSSLSNKEIEKLCVKEVSFFCRMMILNNSNKKAFENKKTSPIGRIKNYIYLRKWGLIKHQNQYLEELQEEIIKEKIKGLSFLTLYIDLLLNQKQHQKARRALKLFKEKKLLTEKEELRLLEEHINKAEKEEPLFSP